MIATVISLMERTYIRIGNEDYEKMYGSYGLTTLKDNHVKVNGDTVHFCFKGKKGIEQKISLRNRRMAKMVQQCRDITGKELFQYYDEEGNRKPVDSGMVNKYIKDATGEKVPSKKGGKSASKKSGSSKSASRSSKGASKSARSRSSATASKSSSRAGASKKAASKKTASKSSSGRGGGSSRSGSGASKTASKRGLASASKSTRKKVAAAGGRA